VSPYWPRSYQALVKTLASYDELGGTSLSVSTR
jgi:hypothetical protein